MFYINITKDQSSSSYALYLTVSGQSGSTGFSNMTIPKNTIPTGATPAVYIDGQQAQNQGYTQDNQNYYVWFTTHFSTHQVKIEFTGYTSANLPGTKTSALQTTLELVVGFIVVPIIVALLLAKFVVNRRKKRDRVIYQLD